MKKAELSYDSENNTVHIDVHSSNIIPGYMFYLLQFHKIPENAIIHFKNEIVTVEKKNNKYKYNKYKYKEVK